MVVAWSLLILQEIQTGNEGNGIAKAVASQAVVLLDTQHRDDR